LKHPAKKQRYDYTLLVVVLLLVGIGLILLYSTSAYNGRVKFHDSFYYLKKQGFATALGLAGMFIVAGTITGGFLLQSLDMSLQSFCL
jgi:cell division protein FtsW